MLERFLLFGLVANRRRGGHANDGRGVPRSFQILIPHFFCGDSFDSIGPKPDITPSVGGRESNARGCRHHTLLAPTAQLRFDLDTPASCSVLAKPTMPSIAIQRSVHRGMGVASR